MLSCSIKSEESWGIRLKSFVILTNENSDSTKDSINVSSDIISIDRDNKKNVFKYDGIFCNTDDNDISKSIQSPVINLLNLGFNSTILINENISRIKDKDNTILTTLIPILNNVYAKDVKSNIDTSIDCDDIQVLSRNISLSCYELYNDIAYDLLDTNCSSSLKLRTHVMKGSYETHVDGLTNIKCPDITNIINEIEKCIQLRLHLISTNDNDNINFLSPISHFFISINIDQTTYSKADNVLRRRSALLSIVSLAPAEALSYKVVNNIANNNSNNTNSSNRESINIARLGDILNGNYSTSSFLLSSKKDESKVDKQARLMQGLQNGLQSLSTLQRVVKILNENVTQDYNLKESDNQILKDVKSNATSNINNKHIPYRDSILTRILQSSLQGNCVLYLLSIINRYSPTAVSSLRFAFHLYNLYTRVKANDQLLGIIHQKKFDTTAMDNFDVDTITFDTSKNDNMNEVELGIESVQFKATLKDFSTDLSVLSEDLLRLEADREIYLSKTMGMRLASRREIVPIVKLESAIGKEDQSSSEEDDEEIVFLSLGHHEGQSNSPKKEMLSTSSDVVNTDSHRFTGTSSKVKVNTRAVSLSSSDDSLKTPLVKVNLRTDSRKATTLSEDPLMKKASSLVSLSLRKQISSSPSSVTSTFSPSLSSSSSAKLKVKSGSISSKSVGLPVVRVSSTSLPAVHSRKGTSTSTSLNKLRDSKNIETNATSTTKLSTNDIKGNNTTAVDKEASGTSDNGNPLMNVVSLLPVRLTEVKNSTEITNIDDTVDKVAISDSEIETTTSCSSTLSRERVLSISCDSGSIIKTSYQSEHHRDYIAAKTACEDKKLDISSDSIPSIQSSTDSIENSWDTFDEKSSNIKTKVFSKKPREIYYISNRRSLIEEDDDGDELSKEEKIFLRYVSSNQTSNAERMLIGGINVHVKNNFERDAIQIASRNGCNEMIEMLLHFNANISSRGLKGDTLFHLSASNGFVETMRLLHKCGILPEAVDMLGQTVCHVAARRGEFKVLEYLHDELGFTYDDFLQENFDGQNCYDVIPRRGYNQEELDLCREYVNLIFQEDPKYKDNILSSSLSSSSSFKLPILVSYDRKNVSKFSLKDLEKRYLIQL